MKTIKRLLFTMILSIGVINMFPIFNLAFAQDFRSPYDGVLRTTTNETSLSSAINGGDVVSGEKGSKLFNDQVIKIISYVIDFFIVIGIAMAFFGGYSIMTSEKEETMKEGIRLVVFGILGIIIMVSARFLATSLVGSDGTGGIIGRQFVDTGDGSPNGIKFADELYDGIMYPFIKVALYFVVGVLFFIMAGKVVSFVTATDDKARGKAAGIIIRCVIGILIVMGSKQIVEAVMGNQDSVLKMEIKGTNGVIQKAPTRIDEQGNTILSFGSVPLIAQVINRAMGLTMLIILVLIIIQGYKIFTKPDDPKTREGMKKAIIYILIGVLVIGAAYVISNVLVINNVPDVTS